MATRYFRANGGLTGSVGSTRYINITTAAAQSFVLGSNKSGFFVFNVGTGNLIWGDSNIAVNSGNYLFTSAGREFLDLQDAFTIFFRADSVSTLIAVSEYDV